MKIRMDFNCFAYACIVGSLEMVKILCQHPNIDINIPEFILFDLENNHEEILKYLSNHPKFQSYRHVTSNKHGNNSNSNRMTWVKYSIINFNKKFNNYLATLFSVQYIMDPDFIILSEFRRNKNYHRVFYVQTGNIIYCQNETRKKMVTKNA